MYFDKITTTTELRKSFKKLALQKHPDKGGSEEEMRELLSEYEAKMKDLKRPQRIVMKKGRKTSTIEVTYQDRERYEEEIATLGKKEAMKNLLLSIFQRRQKGR